MATETVVIDVIANFKDKVSGKTTSAKKAVDNLEKSVEKLGKKKTNVNVGLKDNASSGLKKVMSSASGFAKKTFKGSISLLDKASSVVNSAMNKTRSFTSKAWKATLSVVDRFTSPLTKLKNMLFSVNTLIATVATGLATKLIIADPVSLADTVTTSTISFQTMLGSEEKGTKMMSDIMQFAKDTPFDTQGVVNGVQQMMAYGIEAENTLAYMEKIGNVMAAMGKGEEGIDSVTRALGQMRSTGRVNAQDMMQLTSVGIKAWDYLAEGMGKTVAEVRKMSEDGEIEAETAIQHIMAGLDEFDGMMDKMANTTVKGIASNLKDAFEQSVVLKWGQGLQKGAVQGLSDVKDWLDRIDPILQRAGTSLEEFGSYLSTKVFDGLGTLMDRITESISSTEFKEASLGGKIKILWNDVVWNPFSEWWESEGKKKLSLKMESFGKGLGTGISNGLLTLLGFDISGSIDNGASLGASFAQGFKDGFDGEAVGEAIMDAIKSVFKKGTHGLIDMLLPGNQDATASDKLAGLLLGYGGLKATVGAGKLIRGTAAVLGSASAGTGLLGFGANTAISLGAGNMAGGASLAAGGLSALGLSATAGGVVGGASLIKGGYDLYKSYKAFTSGDSTEGKANLASGGTAIGGVGAGAGIGAAIGSAVPVVGTAVGALVGAGIGGIAGWFGGNKWGEHIREEATAAKFETEELKEAVKDTTLSAEQLDETFARAVSQNLADHFGDVALSLEEISTVAKRVVIGDKEKEFNSFSEAVNNTAVSLEELQNSATALNKMNWKASLGMELSEDDQESFKSSVEAYISDAKEYVESQQYEVTCAVDLLLDTDSESGKGILKTTDAFYASLQEELNTLGDELSDKVEIALKDGVITLDEQAEITNLQEQIASITQKLAEAETEAEFDLIKLKFGKGELDSDSFAELQAQLKEQVDEATASYDEALKVSLTSLKLQLNEGAIDQETYDSQVKSLMEGYDANIEELNAKVTNIQLELLGDSYSDVLGDESKEKLQQALNSSLKDGLDPVEWTAEDAAKYLGVESLSMETSAALSQALGQVAATMPESFKESLMEAAEADFSAPVGTLVDNVTGALLPALEGSFTAEKFGGVKTNLESGLGENIEGVDVSGPVATMKSNCDSSVQSTMSSGVSVDYPITINPYLTQSSFNISGAGTSQTVSFSIGNNATGDIVKGRTLSWLGEEGYPESVIPTAPHRRKRAISLWEKTGEMLGIKPDENATGGIVGGTFSATPAISADAPVASFSPSGTGNVELHIGNITFEIKMNENSTDVLSSIKAQKDAIVDLVSETLYEALVAQFTNTPMAVR